MIKKIISNLLILTLGSISLANCDIPTKINKDQASPCSGYVMNSDTEQKIRIELSYRQTLIENLQKQNILLNDISKIDTEQLKLYREQVNIERKEDFWQKALYFTIGASLTGLIAYGTIHTLK